MKKYFILLLTLLSLATFLFVGCDSSTQTVSNGPNTVHMNETKFLPATITIKKGESITIVNDVSVVHLIQNGTWTNSGSAKPGQETGAPKVELQINGSATQTAGPFTTAGTFQLYCIVHPGMNLTVIVQ
ncbi:MAG: hypothetical protein J2P36_30635 [Ktedonobacteraceae bacterium]|nr:hypothetical protein [Ktedonobacteraceae bacterium]